MLKFLKKYALPMIALILAIGLTIWRINYLERTNLSLSLKINRTSALLNGEEVSLQNPVIMHNNEPYIPINEVVNRLGGTADEKTFTIRNRTIRSAGFEQDHVMYTPISYLHEENSLEAQWDKERNRVILTAAPDEIELTRRYLFWRHRTVRGLRVGDSEERYLDLYGTPSSVWGGMIHYLLYVTVEDGVVTSIQMGHFE